MSAKQKLLAQLGLNPDGSGPMNTFGSSAKVSRRATMRAGAGPAKNREEEKEL